MHALAMVFILYNINGHTINLRTQATEPRSKVIQI